MQNTKSKFLASSLIFLIVLVMFSWFQLAIATTTSSTFNANIGSNVYNSGTTYTTVQAATSGSLNSTGDGTTICGQARSGSTRYVYRAETNFGTSGLPDAATLLNATLMLNVTADSSTANFNLQARTKAPAASSAFPHLGNLWKSDYDKNNWTGSILGTLATSTISTVNIYYNISLTNLTTISLTGNTYFLLISDEDVAVSDPTGSEYLRLNLGATMGPSQLLVYYTYYQAPVASSLGSSGVWANYAASLYCNWTATEPATTMSKWCLEWNNTGPVTNDTSWTSFSGATWSNASKTLNSSEHLIVFRFFANNSAGIMAASAYGSFYIWKYPTPVSEKSFGSGFGNGRDMIYYNATAYGGKPAIYIAYLNTSSADWTFDVNCYDIQASIWLTKYALPSPYAQDSGATYTISDLHWAPSITVLPNIGPYGGHLMYLYAYDSPLFYRLSTYNASTSTNLQQLINSWTVEYKNGWLGGLVPPYDFAYDTPFTWPDRLVMLGRTGEAFQGNISCVKYPANRIVNLWNDQNNTNSTSTWYFGGSAPYLDSSNSSWIYCNSTAGDTTPYFYFNNLTDILSENFTFTLSVFYQGSGGANRAEVWLNNGTNSYNLGNMGAPGWTNFTITSYINNFTKANNAYIYFRKLSDIYNDINISQACIVANYMGLGTDETLVSFMSPPSNRQTAYHTSTKYGNNILVSFNKYWYDTTEASQNGTYFLYSSDKGDTWKSVNGTTVTTPVNGNTLLCYASTHFTRTCPALNQNNVPIVLNQYCPVGWSELGMGWQTKIVSYSGTLGASGTWSIANATDENGSDIYGTPAYIYNCSTFYNRPTFWVSGSQSNNYITKYVMYPNDTTKFKAVWSDTDQQVDGSSQAIVQNTLQAYETVAGDRIFALGNTTASTYNQAASNSSIYGCKFTASKTGTISETFIYLNESYPDPRWDAAIYAENGTVLAKSANNTMFGSTLISWVWHVTYPSPITVTVGTSYYVCFRYGGDGPFNNTVHYYYANDSNTVNQTFIANGYNDILTGNYPTTITPTTYLNRTIKIVATIVDAKMRGIGVDEYVTTFTSTGSNVTVKGTVCLFYTYVSDLSGLSFANFRSNNTGPWVNSTYSALSGTASWCNFTLTLNSTNAIIIVVVWEIWVNDTNNVWASTGTQTITLTVNLVVVLNDYLKFPSLSPCIKALYAPINDALQFLTADMLLKTVLFSSSTSFNFQASINSMKQILRNFAETFKPNLSFNFLKALTIPLGSIVASSTILQTWKTTPFSSSETVKPYASLSLTLNIPTYLTSIVSGLVPIRDSSTMTKTWTNLFSETVRPDLNTILLKSILNPLGSKFSSLGSNSFLKTIPFQTSETFTSDATMLMLKAILTPLGSTFTVPSSLEATKALAFASSEALKPFDYITMTLGETFVHVEALLGDLLKLQTSLGATKNIVYLPADVLKIVGGHFVPSLVPFEYPTASIAWAAAFIIIGLLLGLLLMSKRGDENGQKT